MLTVAAFAAGGCTSDSNPAAPAPPPWLAPNAPKPTFTLSGVVTEATKTGGAPVEGAFVQELRSGLRAITHADGRYSISDLLAGDVHIRTAKEGFLTLTSQVTVGTEARLDVRIVRNAPYVLSGIVFEITPCDQNSGHDALVSRSDAERRSARRGRVYVGLQADDCANAAERSTAAEPDLHAVWRGHRDDGHRC